MDTIRIHCCHCGREVTARRTDGCEVYPHRPDIAHHPFWICQCGNFVGCHKRRGWYGRPLGVIATPELRNARKHIHAVIDPLWWNQRETGLSRKDVYREMSRELGYTYHTAWIRTIDEARRVWLVAKKLERRYAGMKC